MSLRVAVADSSDRYGMAMRIDAAHAALRPDSDRDPSRACPHDPPSYTIVQLAREFGVSLRALRFYEARGFVSPRREGAVRLYTRADRDRIALVLQAKRLGFTLREIADLFAGSDSSSPVLHLSRKLCTEQINHLERQKRDIEAALAELRRVYSSHYLRALESGGSAGDVRDVNR
jgi:DNA-binding transcriptional MerR regulator